MFINDVHKKEEIQHLAIADLKCLGIKYRAKKNRQHAEETKSRKVFKRPLHVLPVETVTLPSGQQLLVPKIVHELCSFIITKIDTEGLFRKGGSKNRQNEIKLSLDAGCYLGEEHHEVDVANVLKTFFRELPDPLIPYSYHELFLRCVLLDKKQLDAVLLACLLLPTVHLNTLAYFMQFLHRVSEYHDYNKMDAYNLAVVIGPTLFPAEEKIPHNATIRMTKTCEMFKLLIQNATEIGVLNDGIIERIAQSTNMSLIDEEALSTKKKKKRRSGSLTRMLSGLKKIVTHKTEDTPVQATPDLIMTPCLTRSAKKRKLEAGGMSAKKRQEIRSNLPQSVLLNMPFTPINNDPSGKKDSSEFTKSKPESAKEKRTLWSSNKTKKKSPEEPPSSTSSSTSNLIQRRWSAVSSVAGFKKKKTRNSCVGTIERQKVTPASTTTKLDNEINVLTEKQSYQRNINEQSDPDYVRISKVEYEEIKNRVSAIERRISIELEKEELPTPEVMTMSPDSEVSSNPKSESAIEEVNKKYEETLVQAEPLCSTTDQLAKRLSKELKIRQSNEHRPVFRSPSARKIGSLRRKEGQKGNRLSRTQTWCVTNTGGKGPGTRNSLRRRNGISRAATATAALQNNSDSGIADDHQKTQSTSINYSAASTSTTSNLDSLGTFSNVSIVTDSSGSSWKSAQGFFSTPDVPRPVLDNNCRASLARLRCQNAGMVMAKARLFDNMGDNLDPQNEVNPRNKNKIGAPRMQINRIRNLKLEEKRKKSMSPRKRPCKSPGIHRLPKVHDRNNVLKDFNRIDLDCTPKLMPHIKRSLNVKSPRKLCKTPLSTVEMGIRQTPMKVSRLVLE